MTRSLIARSRDLRQRAKATKDISPTSHGRGAHILLEWQEAMQLLEEFETRDEAMRKEYIGLESRAFELAGLAVRGPNGHNWMKDFPQREKASEFYQKLRELVKWAAERSRQFR